jgi:hypothetical protein
LTDTSCKREFEDWNAGEQQGLTHSLGIEDSEPRSSTSRPSAVALSQFVRAARQRDAAFLSTGAIATACVFAKSMSIYFYSLVAVGVWRESALVSDTSSENWTDAMQGAEVMRSVVDSLTLWIALWGCIRIHRIDGLLSLHLSPKNATKRHDSVDSNSAFSLGVDEMCIEQLRDGNGLTSEEFVNYHNDDDDDDGNAPAPVPAHKQEDRIPVEIAREDSESDADACEQGLVERRDDRQASVSSSSSSNTPSAFSS